MRPNTVEIREVAVLGPLCVLIVDDCKDTSASLAILVRLWGHEAHVALDGPAALQLAREVLPDVVLLDVGLVGMNGWEVAGRLRRLPGLDGVSLLVLSGFGTEEDVRRSREAGCDLHLVKPVEPEKLRRLLAARQKEIRGHVPRGTDAPADLPVAGG